MRKYEANYATEMKYFSSPYYFLCSKNSENSSDSPVIFDAL